MINFTTEHGDYPFDEIVSLHENRNDFFNELNNYFCGGLVISTPTMFVMAKPVDSKKEPEGQWFVDNPDCWFVQWFAGKGALRAIMDSVNPLPLVQFTREKKGHLSELKTYNWNKLYKLTGV